MLNMLPRETATLLEALANPKDVKVDVDQLRAELEGWSEFNVQLLEGSDLTPLRQEAFERHVAQFGLRSPLLDKSITAPAGGPPQVVLKITAPSGGPPKIRTGSTPILIQCPKCQHEFGL
jgi:hypothetical protein